MTATTGTTDRTDDVVVTPAGAVRGRRDGAVVRFSAVPYATTPRGAARFAAPRPHPGWRGVREAPVPRPTAPQPARDFGRLDGSVLLGPGWVPGSDHLTVDVDTPDPAGGPYPVLVFVHGGGFVSGTAAAPLHDGRAFARDGVVVVGVEYRLGVAGFLDVDGAPPHRGLLDVLAALGWVRDTIAAFGGDPGAVTVAGQSAGATLVAALLATPAASGLFRRAIVQSGSGTGAFTPEQGARVARATAAALGVPAAVDGLAEVTDERLVGVVGELTGLDLRTADAVDPLVGLSPFGLVLPQQPADALDRGPGPGVDLLIGTNADEGDLYLVPSGAHLTSTDDDVRALARRSHVDPVDAEATLDALRTARPGATPGELRSALLGRALFGAGTERLLAAHASRRTRGTFAYRFEHRSGALGGALGAAHAVELPFVFDLADEPWLHGPRGLLGPAPAPEGLAEEVHGAWVAFVRSGDPGWDPWSAQRPTVRPLGRPAPDGPRGAP